MTSWRATASSTVAASSSEVAIGFSLMDGTASLGRGNDLLGVEVVRRGDEDGVESSLLQHVAVGGVVLGGRDAGRRADFG